ncbi:hypothetical protein ABPG74_004853 [Tetrahymena malaccensis]
METIQKKQNTYKSLQELVLGDFQFSQNLEILLGQKQVISQKMFQKLNNFQVLCATICYCKNLIIFKIDLSLCHFGQEEISSIIGALKNCLQLRKISLILSQAQHSNKQKVGDNLVSALFKLNNFSNLQDITLDLRKNDITSKGASYLCQLIEKLPNLKSLSIDLEQNHVFNKGAQLLSVSISKCKYISFLSINLKHNYINDHIMLEKFKQKARKMNRAVSFQIQI